MMKMNKLVILLAGLLALTIVLVACGGASESADSGGFSITAAQQEAPAAAAPQMQVPQPPAAPAPARAMAAPAAPAPAATAAPRAASGKAVELDAFKVELHTTTKESEDSDVGEFSEERAALVAQKRIIVRTVNMGIEVANDVADAIAEISQSAPPPRKAVGWSVLTEAPRTHGFIAVRVPAAKHGWSD